MTRLFLRLNLVLWLCPAVLLAQQAHVNIDWNPHKNTENLAPPYGTNTVSPIVHDDRTVTFRLLAPGADSVMVVGLPVAAGKPVAMKKGEKGLWEATVGPLHAGYLPVQITNQRRECARPQQQLRGHGRSAALQRLDRTWRRSRLL